jgi:hypothetical protein
MKHTIRQPSALRPSTLRLAGALALASLCAPSFAAFVTLPTSGTIMTPCGDSGNGNSTAVTCAAGSVSTATSGYSLLTSTSQSIIAGSTNVGTLYDRVYGDGGGGYIFGMRIDMNDEVWDSSGLTFEVNDMFRSGFSSAATVAGGYSKVDITGITDEYARSIGRSSKGLNETGVGSYDADWVRFETDVNVEDPDDTSPGTSAWYWVKITGASGWTTTEDAIRLWEGGEEDQTLYSIYLTGYTPTYSGARLAASSLAPVPEPSTYAMLLAGLGAVGMIARRRRMR